jgi:CHAT domain-containing protein
MKQWFPSRTDRTISLNANLAPDNPNATALAALVILQRKGRVLDAMSETFASLQQHATPEVQELLKKFNESTAQLARLVLNGPARLSFKEHQKRINELEERKQRLEEEISRISTEFRANAQPVTLDAIQAAIPVDAALIEFAIYRPFDPQAEHTDSAYKEPRYIAYVLKNQEKISWKDLGEAKDIDASIAVFRQALREDWRPDVRQIARMVDKKVMQPIRPLLGNATHLLLSPDGELNLIPFEALVDEQNQYLVQRFSFTYLTSGRDLLRLQVPRVSKTGPVVVANPKFGEREQIAQRQENLTPATLGREKKEQDKLESTTTGTDLSEIYFKPLAGTAEEAQAIKSLFSETLVLSGSQATEGSLKKISAPSILHIATHGFFLTDDSVPSSKSRPAEGRAINTTAKINPLVRSGLAFSGANLQRSTGEDGILTALEATGLHLWGTKLVTLSACSTGLGEVKTGEGVYGLRRAFVLAGTETLVMSLWPVSDEALPEMMRRYYKGLKQGLGRGVALRNVKLSLLKQKKHTHPYYWASFIQSGEWANLQGKR